MSLRVLTGPDNCKIPTFYELYLRSTTVRVVRSVKSLCPVYEQVFYLSAVYGIRRSAAYTRNCNKRVKHMYLTIYFKNSKKL